MNKPVRREELPPVTAKPKAPKADLFK